MSVLACHVDPDAATGSEHLVSLAAAVHRADAHGLDPDRALPHLASAQPIDPADDPVRVLAARIARWTDHAMANSPGVVQRRQRLVAGLVPAADGVTSPEMQRALSERDALLAERARVLADRAISAQVPWLRFLGRMPAEAGAAALRAGAGGVSGAAPRRRRFVIPGR